MSISTHYYVLSLGASTSMLFEAFRNSLIEVDSEGFPVSATADRSGRDTGDELREQVQDVDRCFEYHFALEPLKLVVLGNKELLAAFLSVTAHGNAVIGYIESDHSDTSSRDIGAIVWPVVKEAMSGVLTQAMSELDNCQGPGETASGIEAVLQLVNRGVKGTLLVEEGYHLLGSIVGTVASPVISRDVDVREANDDPVDVVIDKVLESGGNVVFAPNGSLNDRDRIALIPKDQAEI